MELKMSSPKLGGLSPPDCNSDPEEQEVSDDDDDDRNHKHRRRETRSQSLERDTVDQVLTRPFRKRNKPFHNGNYFRENDSQTAANWKSYNSNHLEKDFSAKFDKRRPGHPSLPRSPLDLNQRIWPNQSFSGDPGPGRGRGRDSGSWNQRDPRFGSDIASQMVQGPIPPSLFAGRGLPNVSNAQSASWNAFGLIPGIPNGGLDPLHSIGLQGIRPPIHSSLNMGIPRQRCRDFEERGFCLRGDMCPMEHGINRIVVEDVQSLSQFNLPVSLPNVPGPGPASVSSSSMNSKGLHSKTSKGIADDGLGLNGPYSGSGADLYDPDQPLWNNSGPETSNAMLDLHSPETEALLNGDPSDNELANRSTGNAVSTSVWGRIGSSKSRLDVKEKVDPSVISSDYLQNDSKDDRAPLAGIPNPLRQGKRSIAEDTAPKPPKPLDSSAKRQFDNLRNNRKPAQKALRTLFVNGIPLNSNKREYLLSHFQKFGEVIDIHIPVNSERAFIQFSKREEAEAALKAPDAVMGNRFIKLWWANRDSISDDGSSNNTSAFATPHGVASNSVPPHSSLASGSKDNLQAAAPKSGGLHTYDSSQLASETPRPVNGSKAPPPSQKKIESLEQLKEELRKKQEMLEQKRNEFKRKLSKLENKTTAVKGESDTEQAAKKPKVGTAADVSKAATLSSSDPGPAVITPHADTIMDKNKLGENTALHSPKTNTTLVMQESMSFKQQQPVRPFAPLGAPFLMNRYKLDNRPAAFKIIPPLPAGFANVDVLREHFSPYGDITNVEVEDVETSDGSSESEMSKECSARISFVTRRSAERAFVNGKCWEGHNLKFTWLTPNIPSNDQSGRETSPSRSKGQSDADVPSEKGNDQSRRETSPSGLKGQSDADVQSGVKGNDQSGRETSPSESKGQSDADVQSGEKGNDQSGRETSPSESKGQSDADVQSGEKDSDQSGRETSPSESKGQSDADVQSGEKDSDQSGRETSSGLKWQSDADVQYGEKVAGSVSQESTSSGNGEPENEEKESGAEKMEADEGSESGPSQTSEKKVSP
ncbi:hypothetical protein UlMin_022366 [Ulmus minor]